jgi:hypothetical protein
MDDNAVVAGDFGDALLQLMIRIALQHLPRWCTLCRDKTIIGHLPVLSDVTPVVLCFGGLDVERRRFDKR